MEVLGSGVTWLHLTLERDHLDCRAEKEEGRRGQGQEQGDWLGYDHGNPAQDNSGSDGGGSRGRWAVGG